MIVENSRLAGFTDEAREAMQAAPDYFVHWYTAKSILLVGVAVALAYTLGMSAGERKRRPRYAPDSRWD